LGLVTLVATRTRFRGQEIATFSATYGVVVGACGAAALLSVYACSHAWPYALIPGVVLTMLALVAAIRHGATLSSTERQRLEGLATLGRFAAQMAHDLKNPLAAIKGAAQFLKEENLRKNVDDAGFVDLMLDEVERMHRVIDNYQRLGRVEPTATVCDVNDVVRAVMALQGFASSAGITVRVEHHGALAPVALDRDLVENAIKNLVRNAFEAMPDGGTLTVRTAPNETSEAPGAVVIVEDTGVGMDATTRTRAMESFYTTKAKGSGLGLAYVRRVVEAHGGDLALMSTPGAGTMVRIWLPRAENPPPLRES
jgi:signal transduction histidine kinase